jgi:steroid delta-isomerase-like uncharacterized protein
MTDDASMAAVHQFLEGFNSQSFALMREACTDDCLFHFSGAQAGPFEAHKLSLQPFFAAFPDGRITIDEAIVHGDKIVVRSTYRGTHLHEFRGVAATSQQVEVVAIAIDRIVDGRIAEHWACGDFLGMMERIAAVPWRRRGA